MPDPATADGLDEVCVLIRRIGKLSAIRPDEDIYDAGFSSVSALELLMDLEAENRISIPDERFIAARTPRALHRLIVDLRQESAP